MVSPGAFGSAPFSTLEFIEILPFSKSAIKRSGNFNSLKRKPALFSALERFAAPFEGWSVEIQPVRSTVSFSPLILGEDHGFTSLADSIDSTPGTVLATAFGFVSGGTLLLRTRSVGRTCRASELLR